MSIPRGRPFSAGNTFGRGRPKGSRNKIAAAAQELLSEWALPITKKCIAAAMHGDRLCQRLCMERILAPLRDPLINVRLAPIHTAEDVQKFGRQIVNAAARGKITPGEAEILANTIEILERAGKQNEKSEVFCEPKAVMPQFLAEALLEAQELSRSKVEPDSGSSQKKGNEAPEKSGTTSEPST